MTRFDAANAHSRTYLRFELPDLPAGSKVEEAYLHLFNTQDLRYVGNGRSIPIRETSAWSARTVTFAQPIAPFTTGGARLHVFPKDWCRSDDLSTFVQRHFDDPSTNDGFMLTYGTSAVYDGSAAAFVSLNESRTPRMFGLPYPGLDVSAAPRLLVKVELPPGATAGDVVPPPTDNPDDPLGRSRTGMGTFAPPPRMLIEPGSDWPPAWRVR